MHKFHCERKKCCKSCVMPMELTVAKSALCFFTNIKVNCILSKQVLVLQLNLKSAMDAKIKCYGCINKQNH